MDPVETYLAEILAAISPLAPRELSLADASGSVLAADVTARCPLPPFDNSAMDGYAVHAADTAGAAPDAPVTLPVTAEVPAGDTTPRTLPRGTAIKIMTGALLPAGADAVVPVEHAGGGTHAGRGAEQVAIRAAAEPGAAVRRAGGDAQPGDLLLPAGTRVGPAQLGLLAAAGHGSVLARPRPRVTVISTGNELAEPGAPLVPGQIWESNSWMLAAAARQAGCDARRLASVADDKTAVLDTVKQAAAESDLLVTTGGVSMGGEHDVVKAALSRLGTVTFRKVAMQPGMPQGFGLVGEDRVPIFTLPGNPVSAFVSFRLFVLPAIGSLQKNNSATSRPPVRALLTGSLRSPAGKRSYLRAILDREAGTVAPASGQQSHQLAELARANALIIVPEPVTELGAGAAVDVLELP